MTEDQMREHVTNNGKLFMVTSIDTIRDGGTRQIRTTSDDYFIHKENKTIHSYYPPVPGNIISEKLVIEYLLVQINKFIIESEAEIIRNKKLLTEIINEYRTYFKKAE